MHLFFPFEYFGIVKEPDEDQNNDHHHVFFVGLGRVNFNDFSLT